MRDEKFGWVVAIWRNDLFQPLFCCPAGVILLGAMRLAATQSTATGLASYRILAEWHPGSTHFAASPRPVD